MYELVSVTFPFASNPDRGKPRPGFILSPACGEYHQVIVAYTTTQLDEVLPTDIVLDPAENYFSQTGLSQKSILKLHRLGTFQPAVLKEGAGRLPEELIPEIKAKLRKVFQL